DRDARRALARLHRRRGDPDRDGLLLARDRPRGLRRGAAARLPDAAGRVPDPHRLGRRLQPRRRPPLLQARSEDHRMSVALREPGAVIESEPVRSRRGIVWQTVKRRPSAVVGVVVLLVVTLVAVLAPVIAPYGLHTDVGPVFGHPSWSHPLGLDDGGIDMVTLL